MQAVRIPHDYPYNLTWPSDPIMCQAEGYINDSVEWRNYTARWRYKVPWGTNQWIDMTEQAGCRLYVVLASPRPPQEIPWPQVLDISCEFAWGSDDAYEAMYELWDGLYYRLGGRYDTYRGRPFYAGRSQNYQFDLSNWIVNYHTRKIGRVNCHDMAQSLVILANAVGCDSEHCISEPFGYVNCILPIGCGWTNNPFFEDPNYDPRPVVDGDWSIMEGRSRFGNHGFTRLGYSIYDACVGFVDGDSHPDRWPCIEDRLAARYLNWLRYRERVIDSYPQSNPGEPYTYTFGVE